MEIKKTFSFYSMVIGICIMIVGALGYISLTLLEFLDRSFALNYRNLIGPIICVIGFFVFLIGLPKIHNLRTLNDEERVKYNLSIFFTISIGIYILSLFSPYNTNPPGVEVMLMDAYVHAGGWIGILLILGSLLMLFYHNFKTVKVLCLIGTLSMTLSLALMSILFSGGYYIPTFSFYLFVVSVILNFILTILTMKLLKTTKQIKKQFKLSKVAKAGIYLLVIAVGTLLINLITPTFSSYTFIVFMFPVELVVGLILVIVGLIQSVLSKYRESS